MPIRSYKETYLQVKTLFSLQKQHASASQYNTQIIISCSVFIHSAPPDSKENSQVIPQRVKSEINFNVSVCYRSRVWSFLWSLFTAVEMFASTSAFKENFFLSGLRSTAHQDKNNHKNNLKIKVTRVQFRVINAQLCS